MTNIYFFETREEAKAFQKQRKGKGNKVYITKQSRPYEGDDGKLLYYSVTWTY